MGDGVESVQGETVAGYGELGQRAVAQAPVQLQRRAIGSRQSQLSGAADEPPGRKQGHALFAAHAFLELANDAMHARAKRTPGFQFEVGRRWALPVQQQRLK